MLRLQLAAVTQQALTAGGGVSARDRPASCSATQDTRGSSATCSRRGRRENQGETCIAGQKVTLGRRSLAPLWACVHPLPPSTGPPTVTATLTPTPGPPRMPPPAGPHLHIHAVGVGHVGDHHLHCLACARAAVCRARRHLLSLGRRRLGLVRLPHLQAGRGASSVSSNEAARSVQEGMLRASVGARRVGSL